MFLIIDTGLQGAHKLPECTKDFFEVEVSDEERSKVLQKLLVKFSLWGNYIFYSKTFVIFECYFSFASATFWWKIENIKAKSYDLFRNIFSS